jgi:hypothetical protein
MQNMIGLCRPKLLKGDSQGDNLQWIELHKHKYNNLEMRNERKIKLANINMTYM